MVAEFLSSHFDSETILIQRKHSKRNASLQELATTVVVIKEVSYGPSSVHTCRYQFCSLQLMLQDLVNLKECDPAHGLLEGSRQRRGDTGMV